MVELTPADHSLLSWVSQTGISAHSLAFSFYHHNLIVHCQSVEDATKLWETRTILQMPGQELCFRVDDTFYISATLG